MDFNEIYKHSKIMRIIFPPFWKRNLGVVSGGCFSNLKMIAGRPPFYLFSLFCTFSIFSPFVMEQVFTMPKKMISTSQGHAKQSGMLPIELPLLAPLLFFFDPQLNQPTGPQVHVPRGSQSLPMSMWNIHLKQTNLVSLYAWIYLVIVCYS